MPRSAIAERNTRSACSCVIGRSGVSQSGLPGSLNGGVSASCTSAAARCVPVRGTSQVNICGTEVRSVVKVALLRGTTMSPSSLSR